MAFQKMNKTAFPPRQWALVGYPGSGKSTFAAQMRGPLLVVDADHRFADSTGGSDHRDVIFLAHVLLRALRRSNRESHTHSGGGLALRHL